MVDIWSKCVGGRGCQHGEEGEEEGLDREQGGGDGGGTGGGPNVPLRSSGSREENMDPERFCLLV